MHFITFCINIIWKIFTSKNQRNKLKQTIIPAQTILRNIFYHLSFLFPFTHCKKSYPFRSQIFLSLIASISDCQKINNIRAIQLVAIDKEHDTLELWNIQDTTSVIIWFSTCRTTFNSINSCKIMSIRVRVILQN